METTTTMMKALTTTSKDERKSSRGSSTRDRNIGTIQPDLFTRPSADFDKRGSAGRPVTVISNFVPLETFPDFQLHQYHVAFAPPVDSKDSRKVMLRRFDHLLGSDCIFDGMILYSPKQNLASHFEVQSAHPVTLEQVTITIRRTVSFQPNDPQAINIYNLLVRRSFEAVGYHQVARNFYDPSRAHTIKEYNIELWPGYITAIRLHEEKLMMCIENSHKLLRSNTVYDLMMGEYQKAGGNTELFHRAVNNAIVGNTVMTMYNNKLYRVDDVIWTMNPESELTKFDGTKLTFAAYYKQQYNKDVHDIQQPLLFSRAKNRGQSSGQQPAESRDVYLIPELCHLTGLTDSMRTDRRVMQALATHTRLTPFQRIQSSFEYLKKFHSTPEINEVFGRWQVTIGRELAAVQARELPPEELTGRNPRPYSYSPASGDWARQAKDAGALHTMDLSMWMLIFLKQDRAKAERFFTVVRDMARSMGMTIDTPFVGEVDEDNTGAFVNKMYEGMKEAKQRPVEMIVVVVPNDNKTRYDAIKKICCLEKPVPTQVVRSQTLANEKNFSSVCLKVLLQMNCKLGGSLWKVNIPLKAAMIVGYDLYHDSTQRGKTVGAAVSSLDREFTRWYSQCELHGNPTELGENLGKFVEVALKQWHEKNGDLPSRVLIYRDGCGDGQIPFVKNQEVRQVRDAIRMVGKLLGTGDYEPGLAFIIVTKRVNIRYFKREHDGSLLNPAPGTVVDSVITRPERYDWYMVPQCVRQGTVTPVNYNVIEDTTGLTPDQHQRLAYKLCHLYYNWQGTIRVPAPCQYAQKLAFLVSQSLHESAAESLRDKLYFL